MKQVRLIAVVLVLALLAAIVPAGMAQEPTFGLSDEDFAFWTDAIAASAEMESLAYNFTLGFAADAEPDTLGFSMSGEGVIGADVFSLNVSGELPGEDGSLQPFTFETRVVGDMVYFNLGDGWQGGTVEEALGTLGEQFGGMTGVDPEALAEGDMSDMMAMPGMMEGLAALGSIDFAEYIEVERLDDMSGQAHFSTELLLADLLSSPEFSGLLGGLVAGQMGGDADMSEEQMQQMGAMVGMMFSDLTLTYEQFISTETGLVERGVLDFELVLPAAMAGVEATIGLDFEVNLDYPESVEVSAPESFEPFSMGG